MDLTEAGWSQLLYPKTDETDGLTEMYRRYGQGMPPVAELLTALRDYQVNFHEWPGVWGRYEPWGLEVTIGSGARVALIFPFPEQTRERPVTVYVSGSILTTVLEAILDAVRACFTALVQQTTPLPKEVTIELRR